MLFMLYCTDAPHQSERRLALRPQHKAQVAKVADQLALAGPLFAEDGTTMIGSLLVADFPDRAALDAWLRDEPYTQQGVYGHVAIHPFLNVWPQKAGAPPLDLAQITAFAR